MKSFFLSFSVLLLFTACQQIDLGDYTNTSSNDDTYEVNITSKSGESGVELPYPLTVYAVNEEGLVEDRASITQSGTSVNLSLLSGDFTFYAIAGADAGSSDVPANNIVTASNGYFTNAVMRGKTNQAIDDNEELTLTLSYAVASVDVTLSNIPTDVKAISVKIATLKESMNLDGEYDGSTTATIDLEKQTDGTTWKSATVYVFPSVSAPTTFTVTQTLNDNTTKSYSASYNAKLSAGTPYHFTGTGTNISSHELTVNVTAEGWDVPIEEELVLTPSETTKDSDEDPIIISDENNIFTVSELPEVGAFYNNKHVLGYIDVENKTGLLFSRNEMAKSAFGYAESTYKEEGLSGWKIPTLEECQQIYQVLGFSGIVSALQKVGKTGNISSAQYLYGDGTNAFKFTTGSTSKIIGEGSSDNVTYRIRLVKPITFVIQQ